MNVRVQWNKKKKDLVKDDDNSSVRNNTAG